MRSLCVTWLPVHWRCALLFVLLMLRHSSCNRAGDAVFLDGLQVTAAPPAAAATRASRVCQAPFNTSDPADPGYIFISPSLKSGNAWCFTCYQPRFFFADNCFHRFEFGSSATVELWLQTTRVFFGTSIMAGIIGCLVWQV